LTSAERTALIARLDTKPTKADWLAYDRERFLPPRSDRAAPYWRCSGGFIRWRVRARAIDTRNGDPARAGG
jgi:hypothetical protein